MFAWSSKIKFAAAAPRIETLERRQLLAAHAAACIGHHAPARASDPALKHGIVTFKGGSGVDWMFVSANATTVTVQVNGVDHAFNRSMVKGIGLSGGGGDDMLEVLDESGTFDIP